ncbi:MAG: hypothetical protein P0Y66_07175 [Candidatus Kaistia colombiensis]|nr:MAG: hypothetical protein P0Y66_07175 [Kaistia sp.]
MTFSQPRRKGAVAILSAAALAILPGVVGRGAAAEVPARPIRTNFRDDATGLAFSAPASLVIGKRRGHRGHDFIIEVDSVDPELPRAGTSKSLCGVGLKTQPDDVRALDPAALNAPEMIEQQVAAVRLTLGMMGRVNAVAPMGFGNGVRGVAAIVMPQFGPDHAKVRQFIAIAETPAYRISLSCATTAAAIDKARPLFEALVGSLRIETAR